MVYLEPIQIIFGEGLITAVVSGTNLEFIFESILFFQTAAGGKFFEALITAAPAAVSGTSLKLFFESTLFFQPPCGRKTFETLITAAMPGTNLTFISESTPF